MSAVKVEHKKQLHDQIDERSKQLHATLVSLQSKDSTRTGGRVTDIESALAALASHVAGGWETIGSQGSAALVRWLEASKYLFDATLPIAPATVATPAPITPGPITPAATTPTTTTAPLAATPSPST